jgi:hypothetical protein
MKTKIGYILGGFAAVTSIILLAFTMHDQYQKNLHEKISVLHSLVQDRIYGYEKMLENLKVGDLVEVRNDDNLESSRYLAVAERDQYGQIFLIGRYDSRERMQLLPGLEEGVKWATKRSFRPIYQSQAGSGFVAIATWFWIQ